MPLQHIGQATEMYYELTGDGDVIVFISGHRGDHTFWELVVPLFNKNYRVLVLDNLASGQTTDNGALLTIENMADAVWALIQSLNLKRPIIIGESMGGAIAQVIARKHGPEVSKLVIINSMMKSNYATLMNLEAQLDLRKLNIPPDLGFKLRMPWIFSSEYLSDEFKMKSLQQRMLNNPFFMSIEDQARQLEAVKKFDSTSWASEIHVPALIISAINDIVVLPLEGRKLADTIPLAKYINIKGGHGSIFESADELTAAILQFINAV